TPRDDRRALAEAVSKLRSGVEDVAAPRDFRLDPPVQLVELLAVGPAVGPVAEADDVRRRRRRELESRRSLDERSELLRELAATGDELGEAVAPELLQDGPDARAAPAPARLDAELVQVLARAGR